MAPHPQRQEALFSEESMEEDESNPNKSKATDGNGDVIMIASSGDEGCNEVSQKKTPKSGGSRPSSRGKRKSIMADVSYRSSEDEDYRPTDRGSSSKAKKIKRRSSRNFATSPPSFKIAGTEASSASTPGAVKLFPLFQKSASRPTSRNSVDDKIQVITLGAPNDNKKLNITKLNTSKDTLHSVVITLTDSDIDDSDSEARSSPSQEESQSQQPSNQEAATQKCVTGSDHPDASVTSTSLAATPRSSQSISQKRRFSETGRDGEKDKDDCEKDSLYLTSDSEPDCVEVEKPVAAKRPRLPLQECDQNADGQVTSPTKSKKVVEPLNISSVSVHRDDDQNETPGGANNENNWMADEIEERGVDIVDVDSIDIDVEANDESDGESLITQVSHVNEIEEDEHMNEVDEVEDSGDEQVSHVDEIEEEDEHMDEDEDSGEQQEDADLSFVSDEAALLVVEFKELAARIPAERKGHRLGTEHVELAKRIFELCKEDGLDNSEMTRLQRGLSQLCGVQRNSLLRRIADSTNVPEDDDLSFVSDEAALLIVEFKDLAAQIPAERKNRRLGTKHVELAKRIFELCEKDLDNSEMLRLQHGLSQLCGVQRDSLIRRIRMADSTTVSDKYKDKLPFLSTKAAQLLDELESIPLPGEKFNYQLFRLFEQCREDGFRKQDKSDLITYISDRFGRDRGYFISMVHFQRKKHEAGSSAGAPSSIDSQEDGPDADYPDTGSDGNEEEEGEREQTRGENKEDEQDDALVDLSFLSPKAVQLLDELKNALRTKRPHIPLLVYSLFEQCKEDGIKSTNNARLKTYVGELCGVHRGTIEKYIYDQRQRLAVSSDLSWMSAELSEMIDEFKQAIVKVEPGQREKLQPAELELIDRIVTHCKQDKVTDGQRKYVYALLAEQCTMNHLLMWSQLNSWRAKNSKNNADNSNSNESSDGQDDNGNQSVSVRRSAKKAGRPKKKKIESRNENEDSSDSDYEELFRDDCVEIPPTKEMAALLDKIFSPTCCVPAKTVSSDDDDIMQDEDEIDMEVLKELDAAAMPIKVKDSKYKYDLGDLDYYKENYVVARIIQSNKDKNDKLVYLVSWVGWNYTQSTMQTLEDITSEDDPVEYKRFLEKERGLKAIMEVIVRNEKSSKQSIVTSMFQRRTCPTYVKPLTDHAFAKLKSVPESHGYWLIKSVELKWLEILDKSPVTQAPLYLEGWHARATQNVPSFKFVIKNTWSAQATTYLKRVAARRRCPGTCCLCKGLCEDCEKLAREGCQLKIADGKLVLPEQVTPGGQFRVFECTGRQCGCNGSCDQIIIESGRKLPLCCFYEPRIKGWGVRAIRNIQKGEFVSDYLGEVKTMKECQSDEDASYQFELETARLVIDAKHIGNEARFFSHSCAPNMISVIVYSEGLGKEYHRIGLFASRDIPMGEELCFDYHPLGIRPPSGYSACRCGAPNCRGWL